MTNWANPDLSARKLVAAVGANKLDGHPAADNQKQQANEDADNAEKHTQNGSAKHRPNKKCQTTDCLNCCTRSDELRLLNPPASNNAGLWMWNRRRCDNNRLHGKRCECGRLLAMRTLDRLSAKLGWILNVAGAVLAICFQVRGC